MEKEMNKLNSEFEIRSSNSELAFHRIVVVCAGIFALLGAFLALQVEKNFIFLSLLGSLILLFAKSPGKKK